MTLQERIELLKNHPDAPLDEVYELALELLQDCQAEITQLQAQLANALAEIRFIKTPTGEFLNAEPGDLIVEIRTTPGEPGC